MNYKKKSAPPTDVAELPRNPPPLLRTALIIAIYLFAFILLDLFSQQFEELRGVVAWYPPAGLTYALLLAFGIGFVPAVTIALLISSLFIYRMPQPPYLLFLWAFVISSIYSAAAAFLRKRIHFDWQLRKLQDVIWLVVTTIFVSALLSVLTISSSALSSDLPRSEVLSAIFRWWIGETVGILTITPFLLIHVMPGLKRFAEGQPVGLPKRWSFPRPTLSAIGQASSLFLTLTWVFGMRVLDEYQPFYLITLPIIWIALQRGIKGVSAAILALNFGVVFALWFFRFDLARMSELQLLMIINCIVGLLMGAVVTQRVQAEEALRESQAKLQAIMDYSPALISIKDLNGNIILANQSLAMLDAPPPNEMIGKNVFDLFPKEVAEQLWNNDLAALKAKAPLRSEEVVKHKDETWHTYLTIKFPIYLQSNRPFGICAISNDITERVQAEETLKEYNVRLKADVAERTRELRDAQEQLLRQEKLAVLGQMAGSVGHELRNPLSVINSAVYYLKLVQPDADEKIKEYLSMIEKETRTAEKIITDLLEFARIKSVDREPVSVSELIRQTLGRFTVPASVELTLDNPIDLPQVFVDPRQMEQVLGNLVVNAYQAMPEGGKLTISACRKEELVAIAVKDTGTGISPENMQKLFEPLFTTKLKGIGLGLVVSKKLAEANGGRIEVQSEPGAGSTFTLYLPAKEDKR